jgi:hypothetical protein
MEEAVSHVDDVEPPVRSVAGPFGTLLGAPTAMGVDASAHTCTFTVR